MTELKAPFHYFGSKSRIASELWSRIGTVDHYVDPFCGSLAMLLGNPHRPKVETVNDADGFLVNAWRAIKHDPEMVAQHAQRPVSELDLKAWRVWGDAKKESVKLRLSSDPFWFDVELAGAYIWSQSSLIQGWGGSGIIASTGVGVNSLSMRSGGLACLLLRLSERLKHVRIMCGDWTRPLASSLRFMEESTLVFLDPPYDGFEGVYSESNQVAADVLEWCMDYDGPATVALCGYDGQASLEGWCEIAWEKVSYQKRQPERVWINKVKPVRQIRLI